MIPQMRSWWAAATRRNRFEDDMRAEMEFHLQARVDDLIAAGWSRSDAERQARMEFGTADAIKDDCRQSRGLRFLDTTVQDVRYAWRMMRKTPGFTAAAIISLALGIGANSAIFTLVEAVMLRTIPITDPDRLFYLAHGTADNPGTSSNYGLFEQYAALTDVFDGVTAYNTNGFKVKTPDGIESVDGLWVSGNFHAVVGVPMAIGRGFAAERDRDAGASMIAVISDHYWARRFNRAPDVLNQTLVLNGHTVAIVGVTAPEFGGVIINAHEDVWMPMAAFRHANGTGESLNDRAALALVMVGQRAAHASMHAVRAEFEMLAGQLQAAYPEGLTALGDRGVVRIINPVIDVRPYSIAGLLPAGDMAPRFLALFSIVTLLTLLVVSANVANLMLGRAVDRQRDTAVRRSLGASRTRILRMMIAEGAMIAIVGWAASCLVAWWTARLLFGILEPSVAALKGIRPDWTLAAYAMLLAGVATMAFSAAPAARAWKLQVLPLLKSGEQSLAQGRSRLSNTLVVLQLAFSVLLLTSAGLAYRSLSLLDSGHVGFDAEPMLLATVRMSQDVNTGLPAVRSQEELTKVEQVREHLAQLNHVRAITYSRRVPGAYFLGTTRVRTREGRSAQMFRRGVGPDYLAALGLEPVAGRDLSPLDRAGRTPAAVINQQLAHELFPSGSALGQTLLIGEPETPVEVVGVAPNAFFDGPVRDPHPRYVFVALQQSTDSWFIDLTFFIRYEGTLEAITPIVSRAIAAADSTLPIVSMSTMTSRLNGVTILERQITTMLIGFALTSVVIAALGQYAAAMFNIRRRTRDFGVRMALGASTHQIQRSVVREALLLTVLGLMIGFVLSGVTASAARAALFGVMPIDPPTYLGVLAMLAATSLVASYVPAWRAGRVNVVDALRQE